MKKYDLIPNNSQLLKKSNTDLNYARRYEN